MSAELQKLEKWVVDGQTFIGVFENKAMDSNEFGSRFALPFELAQFGMAEIGQTHAPDTKFGVGWRYLLIWKGTNAQEALRVLNRAPSPLIAFVSWLIVSVVLRAVVSWMALVAVILFTTEALGW